MKLRKEKGITLIALVITIIVLLILAGITIATLTGENGILKKASKAGEETKKAEYAEELKIIGLGLKPDKTVNNWSEQQYMNQYEEEIRRDPMFHEAKEIKQIPNTGKTTIQVVTVEDWVYWVTEDKVELRTNQFQLEPTQIWATLEGDTLKFYATEENAKKNGGKIYGDMQGRRFEYDAPWLADQEQIKAVEFVDEVVPEYLTGYFCGLSSLETVNMEKLKTSNVTDMGMMFEMCTSLTSIDVSGFDTRNVSSMFGMFAGCRSLTTIDVSGFNTRNVGSMEGMFVDCINLTTLDVSNFDTRNVTNMSSMFSNCGTLTSINVSNFDTRNVTDMESMFFSCGSLTSIDVSNFDTSKVMDMSEMFDACENLTSLDISSFDTSNVTTMWYMFGRCENLTTIYIGAKWKTASNNDNMFDGCGTSTLTQK